jgi:hypothetical protein
MFQPSFFSIQDGLDKANEQIEYYSILIRRNHQGLTELQEEIAFQYFNQKIFEIVTTSLKNAKTGYDVARGTIIEKIFYDSIIHSKKGFKDKYYYKALLEIYRTRSLMDIEDLHKYIKNLEEFKK